MKFNTVDPKETTRLAFLVVLCLQVKRLVSHDRHGERGKQQGGVAPTARRHEQVRWQHERESSYDIQTCLEVLVAARVGVFSSSVKLMRAPHGDLYNGKP